MRKSIQGMVAGFLAAIIFTGAVAFAATGTKTLQATYRDIKIVIDGNLITPTDANGNPVEPFIVDGTTYLPVRAVAEAFGKAANWDGNTNTVYIGERTTQSNPSVKLSDLNYLKEDSGIFTGWEYHSEIKDNTDSYRKDCFVRSVASSRDYLINSKYSRIEGVYFLTFDDRSNTGNHYLKIWGDGKLLYESPKMSAGVLPINFAVDVKNVEVLKIGFENDGPYLNAGISEVILK